MKKLGLVQILTALCGLAFFSAAWGAADKPETPTTLKGAKIVSAEEVKSLAAGGAKVYDTRKKAEVAEGKIPGAVALYYDEKSGYTADFDAAQDKFEIGKLPSDKAAKVVFYCNGPNCWKSYKASVVALKAGHKNVLWFRGGVPEWKEKGFPLE